jgi:hypothetical protein
MSRQRKNEERLKHRFEHLLEEDFDETTFDEEDLHEEEPEITLEELPRLTKRRYLVKGEVSKNDFNRINKFLSKPRQDVSLLDVSNKLGIAYHTTERWFNEVQKDQNYSPERALSHKVMSLSLEQAILHTVEEGYLKKGYFFNNRILRNIALRAWAIAPKEEKLKESFSASDSWCNCFRIRYDYVLRKAHLARRPKKKMQNFNASRKNIKMISKSCS